MKKQLLSILLALCMVLALLPGEVWAAERATSGTCGDNLTWSASSGTLTISGSGPMYDFKSGSNTPWYYLGITSVEISDGVTSIGNHAFGFQDLASITIPHSVTSIGDGALEHCRKLVDITIPDGVTSIGEYAFSYCSSLTSITIPNGVTSVGGHAFWHCGGLTSVTIPNSVTSIGDYAFYNCSSLTSISTPGSVTSIGAHTFDYCSSLTSITIPSSVTNIGEYAFRGCSSLTSITIPNRVASIGKYAFHECSSLTSITIPDSVTSIGEYAFSYCSSLTSITIPDSVTSIVSYAFEGCSSLTSIAIPDSVTSIGDSAFEGCSRLTSITIPNSVTSIGDSAFSRCSSLTSITIPNRVTSIGEYTFYGCSRLTSITIPDGVTSIGDSAFTDCSSLSIVTIPSSVTEIDGYAFNGCTGLTDVYYGGSKSQWEKIKIEPGNFYLPNVTIHYSRTETGEGPKPDVPDSDMSVKKINLPFESSFANRINSIPVNWGWNLFSQSAVKGKWDVIFDNDLAITGLTLSKAVESSKEAANTILTGYLGFDTVESRNYDSSANQHPAVTFACKPLVVDGQEQYVFAIVVRGTSNLDDAWTDFSSLWGGFETAATNLYGQLGAFMGKTGLPDSDIPIGGGGRVKFFVTGHSLGGAVANIMAKKLSDVYGADNVFAYTFASPTTIRTWQAAENIVNILNSEDGFTKLPGVHDHRYGWEIRLHRDVSAPDRFYKRFSELVGREFNEKDNAHYPDVYMSFLLSMNASRNTKVTIMCVWCPVDVEVYNSTNQLVGSVKNNVVSDTVDGKTYIRVVGDKKYIYFLDDGEYSVKLTGTDNGTMTYGVQNIDIEAENEVVEQVFQNVVITPEKQFVSKLKVEDGIAAEVEEQKVKLYILDGNGTPEKEVLPDGEGTEVPIETPVDPPASCEHEYTVTVTPPTCTERGYTTHTCGKCNDSYMDSYTAALGHNYGAWVVVVPATATANGRQERVCSRCGDKQTEAIPATGGSETNTPDYGFGSGSSGSSSPTTYNITIPSVVGGTISASPKSAAKGTIVTISAIPDTGYELISMTVLDSNGSAIVLTDKGNGKYTFTMPSGKATVTAVFQPIQPNTPESDTPVESVWSNPYIDVVDGAWYYDAVEFVSTSSLMNGTSNSIFEPDAPLSRAMLAQILYNKEGRPTVASSVFTDVADNAWYADTVAWAATQGIVGGYGNGLFGPDDNITREQLAVMLWRYAGKPAAASQELYFNDADTANSYAVDALCWAVEQGIINGHGNGQLEPQELATRAQVAQIFMNYLKK